MLCLYYLYIREYKLSILFLVLTFLFDCMDGVGCDCSVYSIIIIILCKT